MGIIMWLGDGSHAVGTERMMANSASLEDRIDAAAAQLAHRWTAILIENVAAEKGWKAAYTKRLVGEARSGDPEKGMAL